MKTTNIATVLALFCVATLSACKKGPQFVTPSYSVVSYDSSHAKRKLGAVDLVLPSFLGSVHVAAHQGRIQEKS